MPPDSTCLSLPGDSHVQGVPAPPANPQPGVRSTTRTTGHSQMPPEQTCLLGARNSVQGHRTTKNPFYQAHTMLQHNAKSFYTHLTLLDSQANPTRLGRHLCLTSEKTKEERRSAASGEPLSGGEAPEGLNLSVQRQSLSARPWRYVASPVLPAPTRQSPCPTFVSFALPTYSPYYYLLHVFLSVGELVIFF